MVDAKIVALPYETLAQKQDSLIQAWKNSNLSYRTVNRCVYKAIEENNLQTALGLAKIQILIAPSLASAWNALGEVYYLLGKKDFAKHFEEETKKIDAKYNEGGEKVWEENFKNYQIKWRTKK